MDTKEYVVCRLCGKNFKMITKTHLMKEHNINLEIYKKEFPDAKITSDAMREKMGVKHNPVHKESDEKKPFIAPVEELEEVFSEKVDDPKDEIFKKDKNYKMKLSMDGNEIAVNTYIKSLYPHAVEDYVITIKNSANEIVHEFVTDIAIPNEKIVFDFPNSFFHNSFPYIDNIRNKIIQENGWKIITIPERMPRPEHIRRILDKKTIKASKGKISPNTDILNNI